MVSLLDVNVLVALFDAAHIHHETVHAWFAVNRELGWATCPFTENGMVRVLSNPAYQGGRTTARDALERLTHFRGSGHHRFWDASISLTDRSRVDPVQIGGHRQLTDVYLLATAVGNGGRLATLDRSIPLSAVEGAKPRNLALIEA